MERTYCAIFVMRSLLTVTLKNHIMERTYIFGGDGHGGGASRTGKEQSKLINGAAQAVPL